MYPQSMFLSRIMYIPVNPFYYIKAGLGGQNYIGMSS